MRSFFSPWLAPPKDAHQRLYISRKKVRRRHLTNEAELLSLFAQFGYQTVHLENWSLVQQIQRFQQTSHVVAPHGAGLTNILFLPQQAKILEIRPLLTSGNFCFNHLCAQGWENHEVLVPPQRDKFVVSLEQLLAIFQRWHPAG